MLLSNNVAGTTDYAGVDPDLFYLFESLWAIENIPVTTLCYGQFLGIICVYISRFGMRVWTASLTYFSPIGLQKNRIVKNFGGFPYPNAARVQHVVHVGS